MEKRRAEKALGKEEKGVTVGSGDISTVTLDEQLDIAIALI